ncbi:LCP family protein required for cell wall assembly [Sporosarcina luteola]|nr:LCP family protein required for cell wall assembly [Sporosarcina luteola]
MRTETGEKKSRQRRLIFSLLLVIFLTFGGVMITIYQSFSSAFKTIHEPVKKTSDKREETISIKVRDPFSVLLLGVDEREGDVGRSDSIIVVTVNPQVNSIKMVSIPRDTLTEIAGNGTEEKINHAYARGGVEMSIATVEHFLDLPIDYYVKINMEGFTDIIDALGGVTVVNDMDLTYDTYHFPKGDIELSGEQALLFSRIRYEDPRGDFGRQIRQKQIIQAILHKGASVSSILKYDEVVNALGKNIKTNLTLKDIINIQQEYKGVEKNIEQIQFKKGGGQYIDGYWYYLPDKAELNEVQTTLKNHLFTSDTNDSYEGLDITSQK